MAKYKASAKSSRFVNGRFHGKPSRKANSRPAYHSLRRPRKSDLKRLQKQQLEQMHQLALQIEEELECKGVVLEGEARDRIMLEIHALSCQLAKTMQDLDDSEDLVEEYAAQINGLIDDYTAILLEFEATLQHEKELEEYIAELERENDELKERIKELGDELGEAQRRLSRPRGPRPEKSAAEKLEAIQSQLKTMEKLKAEAAALEADIAESEALDVGADDSDPDTDLSPENEEDEAPAIEEIQPAALTAPDAEETVLTDSETGDAPSETGDESPTANGENTLPPPSPLPLPESGIDGPPAGQNQESGSEVIESSPSEISQPATSGSGCSGCDGCNGGCDGCPHRSVEKAEEEKEEKPLHTVDEMEGKREDVLQRLIKRNTETLQQMQAELENANSPDSQKSLEEVEDLRARVAELEATVEDLESRLKSSPATSSKPPRTRGYGGASPRSFEDEDIYDDDDDLSIEEEDEANREAARRDPDKSPNTKRGGKPGKPKGAPGGGLKMPEHIDKRTTHRCDPVECQNCPNRESCSACQNATRAEGHPRRNVIDVQISLTLDSYEVYACNCPERGGERLYGAYPETATNTLSYGPNIKSLGVVLNNVGVVSCARTAEILRGMLRLDTLSSSTVWGWIRELRKKLDPVAELIKGAVYDSPAIGADETGCSVKGVLHWVHVACTTSFVYFRGDWQRGRGAMDRIGIIPFFGGALLTDCWDSYFKYGLRQGLCNAHILRELYCLVKFFERDKVWAQKMMDLLREMNNAREELKKAGKTAFDQETLMDFYARYDQIIEEGMALHPDDEIKPRAGQRGRKKHTKGRNILDRMKEHKDKFLLFLVDMDVPFTNNSSEKALRFFSVKRSVVGSFETLSGLDDFCIIMTYIQTCHQQGLNYFDALDAALSGNAVSFLFTEEEAKYYAEVAEELRKKNLDKQIENRQATRKAVEQAKAAAEEAEKKADEARQKVRNQEEKLEEQEKKAKDAEKELEEAAAAGKKTDSKRSKAEQARQRVERTRAALERARNNAEKRRNRAEELQKKARKLAILTEEDLRNGIILTGFSYEELGEVDPDAPVENSDSPEENIEPTTAAA